MPPVISKFVVLRSWRNINKGILAIAPESIVKISQCFLLVSLTFLDLHIKQTPIPTLHLLTFAGGCEDILDHLSLV